MADPNWLVAWLLKPSRLRQPPIMRNFKIKVPDQNVAVLRSINTVVDFVLEEQGQKGGTL